MLIDFHRDTINTNCNSFAKNVGFFLSKILRFSLIPKELKISVLSALGHRRSGKTNFLDPDKGRCVLPKRIKQLYYFDDELRRTM